MIALLLIPLICILVAYAIMGNAKKLLDVAAWMTVINVAGFFILSAMMEDSVTDIVFVNILRGFFILSFIFIALQGRYIGMKEAEIDFNKLVATLVLAIIFFIGLTLLLPSQIQIGDFILGTKSLLGMI